MENKKIDIPTNKSVIIMTLILLYFLPFFYCLYLVFVKEDNLYEKQLVWYYVVSFIPAFLTYRLVKT